MIPSPLEREGWAELNEVCSPSHAQSERTPRDGRSLKFPRRRPLFLRHSRENGNSAETCPFSVPQRMEGRYRRLPSMLHTHLRRIAWGRDPDPSQ